MLIETEEQEQQLASFRHIYCPTLACLLSQRLKFTSNGGSSAGVEVNTRWYVQKTRRSAFTSFRRKQEGLLL